MWIERDGELIPKPLLSLEALAGRYRAAGQPLTESLRAERRRDREGEDG